jgi:hypothetical protein
MPVTDSTKAEQIDQPADCQPPLRQATERESEPRVTAPAINRTKSPRPLRPSSSYRPGPLKASL